jgi:hypothetical protein
MEEYSFIWSDIDIEMMLMVESAAGFMAPSSGKYAHESRGLLVIYAVPCEATPRVIH